MEEKGLSIRTAGNTEIPALLALNAKGYKLKLEYTKIEDENDLWYPYLPTWQAEKDNYNFSATTPVELLGLVSMWETRGDDWKAGNKEPDLYDELVSSAKIFDFDGNEVDE
ncbi:MAG: hypothetical protein KME17_28640 [Cyanosarcina radialis HA8281-LM2]|jgi:hypothetical protein|nr:hypothetical protein [Cyanosarcina radialis HA8281-LM2]